MSRILNVVDWKDKMREVCPIRVFDVRPEAGSIYNCQDGMKLMVVGMPNVGKSSLINALRRNYLKKGTFQRLLYPTPYCTSIQWLHVTVLSNQTTFSPWEDERWSSQTIFSPSREDERWSRLID